MKANYKWLKAILVLKIKNFGLAFVVVKLSNIPFFDNFFLDLANFEDLKNFYNFLTIFSLLLIPKFLTLPLLILSYLGVNLFSITVVFSIKVSRVAILLKLEINY